MAAALDWCGCPEPADGGLYELKQGSWFCVPCNRHAAASHVSCEGHAYYLNEYKSGRMIPKALADVMPPGNAPPPPTGQPSDDRPDPPPPLVQARDPPWSAAILIGPPQPAAESPGPRDQVLAHVSVLHAELDTILAKRQPWKPNSNRCTVT